MSARLANTVMVIAVAAAAAVMSGCNARQLEKAIINPDANGGTPATSLMSSEQDSVEQFNEAVGMVADLQYEAALPKLLTVSIDLEAAGDQARAAEAMFWLGYCHEKLDHNQDALDTYTRIIRDYPMTTAAREASARLTRLSPEKK